MGKTYEELLAEIKAAWGIAGDLFDKKLARLIEATEGIPPAQEIFALLRQTIQAGNVEFALTRVAAELADLIKTGKSVPKRHRSSLA